MKIIDLLNKIANGEEVPRSVFYKGEDFVFNCNENTYVCCGRYLTPLFSEYNMKQENFLNDEVEISDESNNLLIKEIERLNNIIDGIETYCNIAIGMNFNMNNNELQNQIVEDYTKMLDKLNKLKGEK